MTFHIGAKPGDIAETVLLPGDPYRARWAAEKFLENPVLVNEVRGMLGYTGTWRGHRVTIHGSGMACAACSVEPSNENVAIRLRKKTSTRKTMAQKKKKLPAAGVSPAIK